MDSSNMSFRQMDLAYGIFMDQLNIYEVYGWGLLIIWEVLKGQGN